MSWRLRLLELIGGWLLALVRRIAEQLAGFYEWLRSLDSRRLAVGFLAVGSTLALGAVLLGGFLPTPSASVARPLYALAVLIPVFGVLVVLYAARLASRQRSRRRSDPLSGSDALGLVSSGDTVVADTERQLSAAVDARYRCRSTRSAATIREELTEGAARVVTARHGLSPAAAREAVRTGEWTDDPVAAGFLGEDTRLPVGEQLRSLVDPGSAYRRRVRRTVAAIERLDDGDTADPTDGDGGSPSNATVEVGR
ncbi:MAG: hypothetical protein PPP55_10105 [Halorubrum sp.]